jgi:hypothetical protein
VEEEEREQCVPTKPPAKVREIEDGRIGEGKERVIDWGRPCKWKRSCQTTGYERPK